MNKNRKILSVLIILVILLSRSIIPVSASSDYYESTYNNYNYDCRSTFSSNYISGEMSYAGASKINVIQDFNYMQSGYSTVYIDSRIAFPQTSFVGIATTINTGWYFTHCNYSYLIGANTVYSAGLF
ncbi:MAG: hypothetical protein GXY21_08740 [Clostridiaceae bacterium]|jgi:hypothetical protein|nr:hypothetical protein [Clostridiaceae bacterium]